MSFHVSAQYIKGYGEVTAGAKKIGNVLVCVFENDTPYKQTTSNRHGQFFFRVDNTKAYTALFYKDGHLIHGMRIINRLQSETHRLLINVELIPTELGQDSVLAQSPTLRMLKPQVAEKFLEAIYSYESKRKKPVVDAKAERAKKHLVEAAIAEHERFKNKRVEQKPVIKNGEKIGVTIMHIGNDTYELQENERHEKKYFKNDKPITEVTYNFETNRRYEGVLKKISRIKRFREYIPREHVK